MRAVEAGIAESLHADARPLEKQPDIERIGGADTAVHLHRFVAHSS